MKKFTVLSLAVVMVLVLLAGCGGTKKTQSSDSAQTPQATKIPQATQVQKKEVTILTNYNGAVDELKDGKTVDSNQLIDYHRSKSGIQVKYEILPKDNPMQKIAVLLASGDIPDLINFGAVFKEDFYKLVAQGAFEPLDELIAKYAPEYKKLVPSETIDAARYNKQLYAFPTVNLIKTNNGIYVRTDILKELNLKEPSTLDEYYNVFKTIKEKKGIIPFAASAASPGDFDNSLAPFAGAFGVGNNTVVKNGKLEFSWLQPEYKEYIAFLKKLYDEGLMDKEFAVNKSGNITEKMVGGKAFMGTIAWWDAKGISENLTKKDPNSKADYIGLPVGKDGKTGIMQNPPLSVYYAIPKNAKNKQAAVEYMNYMSTQDALMAQTYGVKGIDYKLENEKVVQTPEQVKAINWKVIYQLTDKPEFFQIKLEAKGFNPYYKPLLKNVILKEETMYAPPVEAYDKKFVELKNFKNENAIKFIMGNRSLDEFSKFVEEFNTRGGKAAIDAMNEWFTKK